MVNPAVGLCARCLSQAQRQSPLNQRFLRNRLARAPQQQWRYLQTERFQPLAPPNPASLGKPTPARSYPRSRKWFRRLGYLGFAAAAVYALDRRYLASALARSIRTFGVAALVAADYKINFRQNPPLAPSIPALHVRNAQRLFDLLRANGGL